MDHIFNTKCNSLRFFEENTGENLQDLWPGKEHLNITSKA